MTVVKIDGYDSKEKANIIENHILPRIMAELGFGKKDLIISRQIIEYVISKIPMHPGMREVERAFYQLCERILLLRHSKGINFSYKIGDLKFPIKVTTSIVNTLLEFN